jgi:sugar phosphate isomerase/epimerase
MRIGMLTGLWYISDAKTLMESLQRTAALGFRYVDIHGVFHGGPAHLSRDDAKAVKREMEFLGLTPRNYVCHAPHNIPSANDAALEVNFDYLKRAIDLAVLWNVNQMMLNAGRWAFGIRRDVAWNRSVQFLQRLCDYAAEQNMFIVQEAEPYVWFLVNDIASTLRMMEDVARPNFATLVDLGHMALAREGKADLERLGDSIIHAHFSDHEPYLHTNQPIGTGFTPTREYLDALREMEIDRSVKRFGYDELVVSFELGVPGDSIDDPDDRVRRSIEYVQQIAPYVTLA